MIRVCIVAAWGPQFIIIVLYCFAPDVRLGSRNALESHEAVLGLPDLFDDGVLDGIGADLLPLLLTVQARLEGL